MPTTAAVSKPKRMRFETWEKRFSPKKNPLTKHAAVDGCLHETYGAEFALVQAAGQADPGCVWTVVTNDRGDWYIVDGYHFVNRVGYLLTEMPCDVPEGVEFRYA